MNIYKNFLPKDVFKNLKDSVMGYYFPWYFNDFINYKGEKNDSSQFKKQSTKLLWRMD